ncbi:DUF3833 domain-containing protein [Marinobacterium sp. YM272]|uniref:DUF3833 domain-containing protein n=1 Tax=Marinobacterium sp. YM272 TaxID=3421654 RepID=UPI003D7F951B
MMRIIPVAAALLLVAGCSAKLNDYREQTPPLVLSEFFTGQLEAKGMVQDYSGKVVRRFTADIVARWDRDRGVLDEQFVYDDGSQQSRCWRLTEEDNRYTGSAGDVVGEASGRTEGNALNWQYRLRVPVSGDEWVLAMDDWMYLIDSDTLINRTQMSKWGLPVGEITLYIRKVTDTPARQLSEDCRP